MVTTAFSTCLYGRGVQLSLSVTVVKVHLGESFRSCLCSGPSFSHLSQLRTGRLVTVMTTRTTDKSFFFLCVCVCVGGWVCVISWHHDIVVRCCIVHDLLYLHYVRTCDSLYALSSVVTLILIFSTNDQFFFPSWIV